MLADDASLEVLVVVLSFCWEELRNNRERGSSSNVPESKDVFQLMILNGLNTAQKELSGPGGNRDSEERNLCASSEN
jgi:hypothetical protein